MKRSKKVSRTKLFEYSRSKNYYAEKIGEEGAEAKRLMSCCRAGSNVTKGGSSSARFDNQSRYQEKSAVVPL
jgi:hypothetical protein